MQTLEKTYVLEAEDDIVPKQFIGCSIDWKQGQDVTVEQVGRCYVLKCSIWVCVPGLPVHRQQH